MQSPQRLSTPTQLGLQLRAARIARRLTQREVAQRLNLSQSRISTLELDPQSLTLAQLLAWSAIVGLELFVGYRQVHAAPTDAAEPSASGPESDQDW